MRHPFARPSLVFVKQPGTVPRYSVTWHERVMPGAFITRVSGGWRARIGSETTDYPTLDEAKALFAGLLARL